MLPLAWTNVLFSLARTDLSFDVVQPDCVSVVTVVLVISMVRLDLRVLSLPLVRPDLIVMRLVWSCFRCLCFVLTSLVIVMPVVWSDFIVLWLVRPDLTVIPLVRFTFIVISVVLP